MFLFRRLQEEAEAVRAVGTFLDGEKATAWTLPVNLH
jgi:hypothetical protein